MQEFQNKKKNISEKINKLFNGKVSFKNGEDKHKNSNILKSAFIKDLTEHSKNFNDQNYEYIEMNSSKNSNEQF